MRLLVERYKEPTFVVDVINSCPVDIPWHRRCVCGTATVFKHLVENTQNLRKTISLRLLPIPATIRDVMTLVHTIGEPYLWMDSIYIIQDDLKMRQTEIMRMGPIYSSALFTIIAAAGGRANGGFVGVEPGSSLQQIQSTCRKGTIKGISTLHKDDSVDEQDREEEEGHIIRDVIRITVLVRLLRESQRPAIITRSIGRVV